MKRGINKNMLHDPISTNFKNIQKLIYDVRSQNNGLPLRRRRVSDCKYAREGFLGAGNVLFLDLA